MNRWLLLLGLLSPLEAQPLKSYVKVPVADVRSAPKDSAEQVTQALLGDEVQLLESRGDWLKVYVKPQYRSDKGYPGWLHKEWVVKSSPPPEPQEFVWVKVPEALLREKPDSKGKVLLRARLASQLVKAPGAPEGWQACWIPGFKQPLYAASRQLAPLPSEPVSDGRSIVEVAAQLKGTPYLWGGMSCQGIDCSGLTYTAYRVHGIVIPRDADQQFQIGEPIEQDQLKPGDLLFFGDSPEAISHVGIYMWDGKFIHSSGSLGGVTVTPLDTPKYAAIYQGARRVLGSSKLVP
jgi:cell wall-associated NlpC family hydrolase